MAIAFENDALELAGDQLVLDLRTVRPAPAVTERTGPSRAQLIGKRAVDIVVASVALVLAAPVALVIAVAVRLTSGKHVLFKQTRVGRDGSLFTMYKFRTMVREAEAMRDELIKQNEADGLLFKIQDDPRVTRVGKFLRPLGLDELPQFINVLKGDMSLVGPRPALPVEVAKYDARLRERLLVKPGITGLWQINGRHELSFAEYAEYDLHYANNWSVRLDLWVLVATLPALLRRRGAY